MHLKNDLERDPLVSLYFCRPITGLHPCTRVASTRARPAAATHVRSLDDSCASTLRYLLSCDELPRSSTPALNYYPGYAFARPRARLNSLYASLPIWLLYDRWNGGKRRRGVVCTYLPF